MGNTKNKVIKSTVLIIMLVAVLAVGVSIINISMAKAEERQKISKIEELISEGNYNEAIESIDELLNNDNYSRDNKIISYKNLLSMYNYIDSNENIIDIREDIEKLKNDYSELLKEDIFTKLNESILQKESQIDNYLAKIEGIKNLKEKIIEAIENDIESVHNLIDRFKNDYPEEDISDIEKRYSEKLIEIEKEKTEEEKQEYSNFDSMGNTANDSFPSYNSKLGIANTVAAQTSSQIVTVVSNGGSYGELVMWEKDGSGNWREVDRVAARLGQNGMKAASEVYEMDKCTPTGIYTLTEAFGINGNPGSGVPYRQLDGSEYWVDDVDSEYYNTMQFGDPNGRWNSAEKLVEFPGYYNYSLVIDYNRWPVIPGKSSAIFLHCDMGIYTYGCVAIPQSNLINLLTWLNPDSNPVIILDFDYNEIYNNY